MIAYNNNWLNNLQVQQQLEEAAAADCISKEEEAAGIERHPVGFYTPNIFIRIGLFILTAVTALFSLSLMALVLSGSGGEKGFGILLLLFSVIAYVALEVMVQTKHHYKSGVDDALIWITGACGVVGINLLDDISVTVFAILVLLIALYFLLRFGNAVMGMLVPVAFLYIILLTMGNAGNLANAVAPFLLMLIAVCIYFTARFLMHQPNCRLYKSPLTLMKITALICLYAAVNYYTVREVAVSMFHPGLSDEAGVPFGRLFWIFTFCIPLLYIFLGVQKKDIIFLRVGLVLVAAIAFTVRYYYAVAPIEIAMTVGGAVLITIAYVLIQYLRQPKYGFTSEPDADTTMAGKLAIEALVIAETFTTVQPAENTTNYGGGSFGGGGASGDF